MAALQRHGLTKKSWIIATVLLVMIVLLIAGYLIRSNINVASNAAAPASATVVNFVQTRIEQWAKQVHAVGTVVPDHRIQLAAQTDGLITQVNVKSGQAVKKGQLLYQVYSGSQAATLKQAMAKFKISQDLYQRDQKLYKSSGISPATLFQNKQAYLAASAAVQTAREALKLTEIVAPEDGVVGLVNIKTGNYVTTGQVLNTIVSNTSDVVFSLPVHAAQQVKLNDVVLYSWGQGENIAQGRIVGVDNEANPNDHMQNVKASINKAVTAGSFVTVVVQVGKMMPMVVVPSSAIDPSIYGDSLYRVVNGHAVPISVQVGEQRGVDVAVQGVGAGVTVVNGGLNKITPNAPVSDKNALN